MLTILYSFETITKLKIRKKTITPNKAPSNNIKLVRPNHCSDMVGSFEVGRPDDCWDY